METSIKPFCGSIELGKVLRDLPMTCLDVGARGGFTKDLWPISSAVDAIGFEPDPEECARLNHAAAISSFPWRTLRFIPVACARDRGTRTLHLYAQRGCSSLLEADVTTAKTFSRADYYRLDGTAEVRTTPLDVAAEEHNFPDAVYLKVDVQGVDLEVLTSAPRLLSQSLLAVRTEVSFLPMYKGEPVYKDIEACLRDYGFMPMDFVELHHWRRLTREPHDRIASGAVPYSRGQLVHGDMLFFRDTAGFPDDTTEAARTLLKTAFLALSYEYVDHAAAILTRPGVAGYLKSQYDLEVNRAIGTVSQELGRRRRRSQWGRLWRDAGRLLRGDLVGH